MDDDADVDDDDEDVDGDDDDEDASDDGDDDGNDDVLNNAGVDDEADTQDHVGGGSCLAYCLEP